MESFLSIDEAVRLFDGKVSRSTIWRNCVSGSIPAVQIGSRWLIRSSWAEQVAPPDDQGADA